MKNLTKIALVSVAVATSANAAIDVSGVTLDTGPVEAIGVIMLTALGLIWVAKRVVGFLK